MASAYYEYLTPSQVYYRSFVKNQGYPIVGRPAVRAYWVPHTSPTQENAESYAFAFKTLQRVILSPNRNAYMIIFEDGSTEDLCSYDTVCVKVSDS